MDGSVGLAEPGGGVPGRRQPECQGQSRGRSLARGHPGPATVHQLVGNQDGSPASRRWRQPLWLPPALTMYSMLEAGGCTWPRSLL